MEKRLIFTNVSKAIGDKLQSRRIVWVNYSLLRRWDREESDELQKGLEFHRFLIKLVFGSFIAGLVSSSGSRSDLSNQRFGASAVADFSSISY